MATITNDSFPFILIIPGAWLPSSAYRPLEEALGSAGFLSKTANLLTVYESDSNQDNWTIDADADNIRIKYLTPLIESEGRDVILLMHSYGAMPGSVAADYRFTKAKRMDDGNSGGVVGLISLSGFMLGEGKSLADGQGGQLPPFVLLDQPSKGLTLCDNPSQTLYNIPSNDTKNDLPNLLPHASHPFYQPSPPPAWTLPAYKSKLGFIICLDDNAVPVAGQKAMIQYSGQEWMVEEVKTGHCGFLVDDDARRDVVGAVEKLVRKIL